MNLLKSIKLRFVVWVWNHTPNCAEMSRLASRSLDGSLTLKQRWQMRLHRVICAWCRRYLQQLSFLHTAAPQLEFPAGERLVRGLPAEARQRILQAISAASR